MFNIELYLLNSVATLSKNFGFLIIQLDQSEIENPKSEILTLPDQDSNLDKRYQKPSYYHYTIRQSPLVCKLPEKERKYKTNNQNSKAKFKKVFRRVKWPPASVKKC
jgi:hypothetical protein